MTNHEITQFTLEKLVENSFTTQGQLNDLACGLKEISDKLDTLIAMKQAELSRQPRPQEPQPPTE